MEANNIPEKRVRLAAVEAELAGLRAQYDVLMNAFKFDEARALAPRVEAAERERAALVAALPELGDPAPAPYAVARRRRRR